MTKKLLITLALSSVIVLLGGCDDEKSSSIEANKSVAPEKTAKIEIIKNDNPEEIKVKQKKLVDANGHKDKYYYDYNIKSEYDSNSQPANKDASIRTKPRTNIEANMNVRSPYEEVEISLLVRKLSKKFIIKCSACHNDYANGVIGPSLLGKDSNEIFTAIADFKSGKKQNVLMDDLINMMSDDEIREIADEIYAFNQEIKEARKK